MGRPNLFILGAGKCGTTSLHKLLANHPQIHMSQVKEPTFFCSSFQIVRRAGRYYRLFDTDRPVAYRGESSHAYLTDPPVGAILGREFPDARLIVILRDPARRSHSLYRHMRKMGLEDEPTFLAALKKEPLRRGGGDPSMRWYEWNYYYLESSRFDVQLERYFALFDRRQVFVATLAEFAGRFDEAYGGLLDFLGLVRPAGPAALPFKNSGGRYEQPEPEAGDHLQRGLGGVADRVDTLVGRRLDWSM